MHIHMVLLCFCVLLLIVDVMCLMCRLVFLRGFITSAWFVLLFVVCCSVCICICDMCLFCSLLFCECI